MPLPDGFTIRAASTQDLDVLVGHRRAMFRDMGHSDQAGMDRMTEKLRPWLLDKLNSGEYVAWLVIAPDGAIAAGAGLWLMDWIPHVIGAGPGRGNILNVYTESEYRRRGLARCLVETAVAWCRDNGVDTVILHASPEGRALYESLGFAATNEMRIRF
jgi:GNAT superfamily N-acetyltransferase